MKKVLNRQAWKYKIYYAVFGIGSLLLLIYYLSDTVIHFTTTRQFPINSLSRYPLSLLIFPAEIFTLLFSLYFVYLLLTESKKRDAPEQFKDRKNTRVAVLIPVYNEPRDIVERTLDAVRKLKWPGGIRIYLLDDSKDKASLKDMDAIAKKYRLSIVTDSMKTPMSGDLMLRRKGRIGFKAGNINNAIKRHVTEEYFIVLDSDQAPSEEFLLETMDYFSDPTVGFVQTPQYFVNDGTPLERAAKLGANIFFFAQTDSKAKDGAIPFCGTNVVIRSEAFRKVNGFVYYTSTEDIELGIRLNDAGYHGEYVSDILVYGYAPSDFKAYSVQQRRWSNGNLAILRESFIKLIFGRRFSIKYLIHTFFTLGWWMIGICTLIFILVPIISLTTGLATHHTWLPGSVLGLLYINVVLGILMIYVSLHGRDPKDEVTIMDAFLQYSLITNSMFIYIQSAIGVFFKRYIGFQRTDKGKATSGLGHVKWNLVLSALCFGLSTYALYQSSIQSTLQGLRTFIPVSLWLLFYSTVLASSVLFVSTKKELAIANVPAPASFRAPSIADLFTTQRHFFDMVSTKRDMSSMFTGSTLTRHSTDMKTNQYRETNIKHRGWAENRMKDIQSVNRE